MDVQAQRALAHPKRTEILAYLVRRAGVEGADETQLADSLGLTTAKVKYHLAVLRNADLV